MYEAFVKDTIYSSDKSSNGEFTSTTCSENRLFVGTSHGVLHVFTIDKSANGVVKIFAARAPIKQFARKSILKLKVIEDLNFLVCLCDGYVAIHDLSSFAQVAVIERSKGAIDFSAKITRSTEGKLELCLCIAIKRRVMLLAVKDRRIVDLCPNRELSFPEVIKKIEWVGEKAVVAATKSEYHLFSDIFASDKTVGLIATSNYTDPFILPFQYNQQSVFAICQDNNMPLFDLKGGYVRIGRVAVSVKWSEPVVAVEYRDPYFIGLLGTKVEIRSPDPQTHIQSFDFRQKSVCISAPPLFRVTRQPIPFWNGPLDSPIFFVTTTDVYALKPKPIVQLIEMFLSNSDFALAGQLGAMVPGDEGKAIRIKIKSDSALSHHAKLEFSKSLELFAECNTDLVSVIRLYPGILPDESRSEIDQKVTIPPGERQRAYSELVDHLVMRRLEIQANNSDVVDMYLFNGVKKPTVQVEALTMIDTATIKCYLETNNDKAVGAVLRQTDCACHLQITERLLKERQMYKELILLYRRFKQHKRALELLERHAKMADSQLYGHTETVEYLQCLGENEMAVLFEFAEWVVKCHPEDGLKIFTGPGPSIAMREGGPLPVEAVVNYLERKNPDLLIPYIEFFSMKQSAPSDDSTAVDLTCGFDWKSLHSRLALLYLERYKRLQTSEEARGSVATIQQQQQQQNTPSFELLGSPTPSLLGGPLPPPGSGTSSSNQMTAEIAYAKLMEFLSTSVYYEPERLMGFFAENSEPKALLLGRSGEHERALSIFVLSLRDLDLAEKHCDRFYTPNGPASKVYHIFVRLLLSFRPSGAVSSGVGPVSPADAAFQTECLNRALNMLDRHPARMDHVEILSCLPDNLSLQSLQNYLLNAVRLSRMRLRQSQIRRALNEVQLLIVKRDMVRQHSIHFTVDDESVCTICNMKIGLGTFIRRPTGALAHYLCFNEQIQRQPLRK